MVVDGVVVDGVVVDGVVVDGVVVDGVVVDGVVVDGLVVDGLVVDGKLYRAPIPNDVQRVLDVGCGTGIWAIEFADEHPSAHVIGTDLSPIQPEHVPPNCEFLIDDCTKDWIFHHPFDYIHTRAMVAAIKDWGRFLEQAYENLKPGGYLECQELTFPIICMDPGVTAENSPLMRWSDLFFEATAKINLDAGAPRHLAPKFRDAGFVDINLKTYKWPLGKWAKEPSSSCLDVSCTKIYGKDFPVSRSVCSQDACTGHERRLRCSWLSVGKSRKGRIDITMEKRTCPSRTPYKGVLTCLASFGMRRSLRTQACHILDVTTSKMRNQ